MYIKLDPQQPFGPSCAALSRLPDWAANPRSISSSWRATRWGQWHRGRAALHRNPHQNFGVWLHQEQSQRLSRPTARQQTLHIICLALQQRRNSKGREQENNARSSSTSQRVRESCRATTTRSPKLNKNLAQGTGFQVLFFPHSDSCNFCVTSVTRQQQAKEADSCFKQHTIAQAEIHCVSVSGKQDTQMAWEMAPAQASSPHLL